MFGRLAPNNRAILQMIGKNMVFHDYSTEQKLHGHGETSLIVNIAECFFLVTISEFSYKRLMGIGKIYV